MVPEARAAGTRANPKRTPDPPPSASSGVPCSGVRTGEWRVLGEVGHEGESVPGQHERIIPLDLWKRIQMRRDAARQSQSGDQRAPRDAVTTGMGHDR